MVDLGELADLPDMGAFESTNYVQPNDHVMMMPTDFDDQTRRRKHEDACEFEGCHNEARHTCFTKALGKEYGCGKRICKEHLAGLRCLGIRQEQSGWCKFYGCRRRKNNHMCTECKPDGIKVNRRNLLLRLGMLFCLFLCFAMLGLIIALN